MSLPSTSRAASAFLHPFRSSARTTCRHRAPRISACASQLPGARREEHTLRPLLYSVDEPLGDFWSVKQLRTVAVDYQQGLIDRLNESIKGTEYEHKTIVNTVLESARNREDALIFNWASQAMNNSFFLDNLTPRQQQAVTLDNMSHRLQHHLEDEFGGTDQFISYMSAAAMGMVGSGWVWLVVDKGNRLAVTATYGAGTMLIRQRQQASPLETKKDDAALFGGVQKEYVPPLLPPRKPGEEGENGQKPHWHPGSLLQPNDLVTPADATLSKPNYQHFGSGMSPIMVISVHEHAWLHDYGVWGKEEYLKRFWTVLDWAKVSRYHDMWVRANEQVQAANAHQPKGY